MPSNMDAKFDPMNSRVCARKLAALAAPERLQIIHFLRGGPRNATEISVILRTPLVNVSHHLGVLFTAGLLNREKHGRFVIYSLPEGLLQADETSSRLYHLDLGCCRLELPGGSETPTANA